MSFCATGSLIDAASVVASPNLRCRSSSIACFVAARSGDNGGAGAESPAADWLLGSMILNPSALSVRFVLG